jgi:hypothetical protein
MAKKAPAKPKEDSKKKAAAGAKSGSDSGSAGSEKARSAAKDAPRASRWASFAIGNHARTAVLQAGLAVPACYGQGSNVKLGFQTAML